MDVNENMYYLIRYVAEFHKPPKAREIYEGRKIGLFLHNVKRGSQKISSEDALFLARLGIKLSTENVQNNVHKKLLILVDFIKSGELLTVNIQNSIYITVPEYRDHYLTSRETAASDMTRKKVDIRYNHRLLTFP